MRESGLRLKISEGNSKVGKIPNVSLPPKLSCKSNVRCYEEGCYAKRCMWLYKKVREAWTQNWKLWNQSHNDYFNQLHEFLSVKQPELFRYHVGGDIPDQMYYDHMVETADMFQETTFLAFTKRDDLYMLPQDMVSNLRIILSVWPSMPVPDNPHNLPMAWLIEDWRRPFQGMYLTCPGKCYDCKFKCWTLVSSEVPVFFPKH